MEQFSGPVSEVLQVRLNNAYVQDLPSSKIRNVFYERSQFPNIAELDIKLAIYALLLENAVKLIPGKDIDEECMEAEIPGLEPSCDAMVLAPRRNLVESRQLMMDSEIIMQAVTSWSSWKE